MTRIAAPAVSCGTISDEPLLAGALGPSDIVVRLVPSAANNPAVQILTEKGAQQEILVEFESDRTAAIHRATARITAAAARLHVEPAEDAESVLRARMTQRVLPTITGWADARCCRFAACTALLIQHRVAQSGGAPGTLTALLNGVCRRTGRLVSTHTHLDLELLLDQVNLDVRRAACDVNPGSLPWLGRVVTFHYVTRFD